MIFQFVIQFSSDKNSRERFGCSLVSVHGVGEDEPSLKKNNTPWPREQHSKQSEGRSQALSEMCWSGMVSGVG